MRIFILLYSLLSSSVALGDLFAFPSVGYLKATTTGEGTKKDVSGLAYQVLIGYKIDNFFIGPSLGHAMTAGAGEKGDVIALGARLGMTLGALFPYAGYDYKFQYGADIVAAANGTAYVVGTGYDLGGYSVMGEYRRGTFKNFGGVNISNEMGMNTYAIYVGVPIGRN